MPLSYEICHPFLSIGVGKGGGLPPPCRLRQWESGSLFCLNPSVSRHGSPCVTMVTGTGSAWWVWRERGEGGRKKRPPAVFHQQPKGNLAKNRRCSPTSCLRQHPRRLISCTCVVLTSCFYPCTLHPSFSPRLFLFLLLSLSSTGTKG